MNKQFLTSREFQAKVRAERRVKWKRFLAGIGIVAALASVGYMAVSWHIRETKLAEQVGIWRAYDLILKQAQIQDCTGRGLDN